MEGQSITLTNTGVITFRRSKMDKTLTNWIVVLTARGYSIVNSSAITHRHAKEEEHWNSNYPMTHIDLHLKKDDKHDLIIHAYSCNNHSEWSIYAEAFSGKKQQMMAGFIVTGKKETSMSSFDDLLAFVKDMPPVYG